MAPRARIECLTIHQEDGKRLRKQRSVSIPWFGLNADIRSIDAVDNVARKVKKVFCLPSGRQCEEDVQVVHTMGMALRYACS